MRQKVLGELPQIVVRSAVPRHDQQRGHDLVIVGDRQATPGQGGHISIPQRRLFQPSP
jgi:hypothetical protein